MGAVGNADFVTPLNARFVVKASFSDTRLHEHKMRTLTGKYIWAVW